MSPEPGGYRRDWLLEEDEENSEVEWVDDGEEEEEEEEGQAHSHTLKVVVNEPHERGSLVKSCEPNPTRLKHSRMSFFLSGLMVMALTMLWLAFI